MSTAAPSIRRGHIVYDGPRSIPTEKLVHRHGEQSEDGPGGDATERPAKHMDGGDSHT